MTEGDDADNVEWTATALRALDRLPAKVAVAVVEFVFAALAENPHRVGRPLKFDLEGLHSGRRSEYRIIYIISDESHSVVIDTIGHRSDVYRRR